MLNNNLDIKRNNMEYNLNNILTMHFVSCEFKKIHSLFKSKLNSHINNFVIDLQNIITIDSSGIALLVEIPNIAKRYNKQIKYINHTQDIHTLCKIYSIKIEA